MTRETQDNWGEEDDVYDDSSPIILQHVMETDCWIYRLAIIGIILFALSCVAAIVYLGSQGKDFDSITTVLGTAVGGLVGIFVSKKS